MIFRAASPPNYVSGFVSTIKHDCANIIDLGYNTTSPLPQCHFGKYDKLQLQVIMARERELDRRRNFMQNIVVFPELSSKLAMAPES